MSNIKLLTSLIDTIFYMRFMGHIANLSSSSWQINKLLLKKKTGANTFLYTVYPNYMDISFIFCIPKFKREHIVEYLQKSDNSNPIIPNNHFDS